MSIVDLIRAKRDGRELEPAQIRLIVHGAATGTIPDYQLSAFLMAVYHMGMTPRETADLTLAMADSGARLNREGLAGKLVDKHSTGGVGDKVSLILAPIVASCGVGVPMISGRGLGHTGGTVDKLESIPGFRTALTLEEVRHGVAEIGLAMAAQTERLAPADRRLYALRDVTATVESLPLITASILSKKLAESLDALVMDVKTGRGAFMQTESEARELARSIVDVAAANSLPCTAFITRMDAPLGRRIGNWLEVCEAVRVLRGEETPPLLMEVTLTLAGACLLAGGRAATLDDGIALAARSIADGSAYERFLALVRRQGGDVDAVERACEPEPTEVITSNVSGVVTAIDALRLGLVGIELGAGRRTLDDIVAPQAGIVIHRHVGEPVEQGEALCSVVAQRSGATMNPADIRSCFAIGVDARSALPETIVEIIA